MTVLRNCNSFTAYPSTKTHDGLCANLCPSANRIRKVALAREVIDFSVTDQWVTLNCSFCYLCGLLAYCRVWGFGPSHDLPYGLRTCVAVTAFKDHGSWCDVVGRLLHSLKWYRKHFFACCVYIWSQRFAAEAWKTESLYAANLHTKGHCLDTKMKIRKNLFNFGVLRYSCRCR